METRTRLGTVRGQRGFTLIEVMIVLVILGLLLALVAPAPLSSRSTPDDALHEVIDVARRTAVRRGSALTLSLDEEGRWTIEAEREAAPLLTGTLDPPRASPMRLHISPLGACMAESNAIGDSAYKIDPVRCRLNRPRGDS